MSHHRRFHAAAQSARQAYRRREIGAEQLEALLVDALAANPWARPGTERGIVDEILRREERAVST